MVVRIDNLKIPDKRIDPEERGTKASFFTVFCRVSLPLYTLRTRPVRYRYRTMATVAAGRGTRNRTGDGDYTGASTAEGVRVHKYIRIRSIGLHV